MTARPAERRERYTVRFVDVGREHLTWEVALPDLEPTTLERAVVRKRALASRGIECYGGNVIVGGFRVVGRYEVIAGPLAPVVPHKKPANPATPAGGEEERT